MRASVECSMEHHPCSMEHASVLDGGDQAVVWALFCGGWGEVFGVLGVGGVEFLEEREGLVDRHGPAEEEALDLVAIVLA